MLSELQKNLDNNTKSELKQRILFCSLFVSICIITIFSFTCISPKNLHFYMKYLIILFENLFKPRQRRLAVCVWLLTSSVLSTTSKQCFELTSSVSSTTSKQCFEQPVASFLVCSLIFIEYKKEYNDFKTNYMYIDKEGNSLC